MECANQIKMCRVQMKPCDFCGHECDCPMHTGKCSSSENVPSFSLIINLYRKCAEDRAKTGKPAPVNLKLNISKLLDFVKVLGLTENDSVDNINRKNLTIYAMDAKKRMKGISVRGSIFAIRSIFARWARLMYEDMGYTIHGFDSPDVDDDSERYHTLSNDRKRALLEWYRSLQFRPDRRERVFAMMMYKCAMRNSDVSRLKWSNFSYDNGKMVLKYTPHKTSLSSKRTVTIELTMIDQIELEEFRADAQPSDFVISRGGYGKSIDHLERKMNAELRAIGFEGSKGLYELRKACVDSVYHSNGAEAASAISGDEFKTIKKHYADPSMKVKSLSDESMCL